MPFKDFPEEFSLGYRLHVLNVYMQSTLDFAAQIAADGPEHLDKEEQKIFIDLSACLERAWFESEKLKKRVTQKKR